MRQRTNLGVDVVDAASSPFELWEAVWVAINGRESFDANSWCWAYQFEVLQ